MDFKSILNNKVVIYLSSRYLTYFIQFVTSLIIAARLGPYYFGIWGFILLMLNYAQQCHFGIYNSLNVLYVQNRKDAQVCKDYIANAFVLISYLSLLMVLFFGAYTIYGGETFEKYHAERYIVWICVIAILQYFQGLAVNIFRVKNLLGQIAFSQSIVAVLNFLAVFLFTGETLILSLIAGNAIGYLAVFILLFASGTISFNGVEISTKYQKNILCKGIMLFLYNTCFYFIILSIRTIVSSNYSVEEFGIFTFSFSLAHAIMLLLESLSFIVFPKIIGKLASSNLCEIKGTIRNYRIAYVTTAHGLLYLAMIAFPLIEVIFPKYQGALVSMNLIGLTILTNTCGCGYTEYLIAQNKEKQLSVISISALIINCFVGLFLAVGIKVTYSYVILGSLIAYLLFTFTVAMTAKKLMQDTENSIWRMFFPGRLFFPYLIALVVSILQYEFLIVIPFIVFILLNVKDLQGIFVLAKQLLKKPEIVNL